jgi:hypothetical protein
MIFCLLGVNFELQFFQCFRLRQQSVVSVQPKLKKVDQALDHGDLPIMGFRQKDFGLVDHQVRIDPGEQLFIHCGLEDHVFIEHEMTVQVSKFMTSLSYQAGVVECVLRRVEISELLDGAIAILIVPDFLYVI